MPLPFEVSFDELRQRLDQYVDAVFDSLTSEFLVMPKGPGFVEFPVFDAGYEALKRATGNFADVTVERVLQAIYETPISFVVLRCILGFTPPEWAWYTSNLPAGGAVVMVSQSAIRTLDRKVRLNPLVPLRPGNRGTDTRIRALVGAACQILQAGAPRVGQGRLHRLDKADTAHGLVSLRSFATLGAPYPVLLYERFLGRPFAGHRDSISELVGNVLENLVEDRLVEAGVSFRRTRRAERLPGFDQAPDFVVPSEVNPRIVIEAKLTEDDGTARDKVTRVQHLSSLSLAGQPGAEPRFELIACIAGRGFRVRREDMKKLLLATRGKVFTLDHLDRLVDATALAAWRTRPRAPGWRSGRPGSGGTDDQGLADS